MPFVGLGSSEMRSDTHDLDSNTSVCDHVFTVDQKNQKIFYKKVICMKHTAWIVTILLSKTHPKLLKGQEMLQTTKKKKKKSKSDIENFLVSLT